MNLYLNKGGKEMSQIGVIINCEKVKCVQNDKCYTENAKIGKCTSDEIDVDEDGNCESYEHYSLYPD